MANARKSEAHIRETEMDFLSDLLCLGGGATNSRIPRYVSRQEDRLRQVCRRSGWVEFAPVDGRIKGWKLTPVGQALAEVAKSDPELWDRVVKHDASAIKQFDQCVHDRQEILTEQRDRALDQV